MTTNAVHDVSSRHPSVSERFLSAAGAAEIAALLRHNASSEFRMIFFHPGKSLNICFHPYRNPANSAPIPAASTEFPMPVQHPTEICNVMCAFLSLYLNYPRTWVIKWVSGHFSHFCLPRPKIWNNNPILLHRIRAHLFTWNRFCRDWYRLDLPSPFLNTAQSFYGCGPNSCSISRAISMLFCEIWRARIANIWSNPSPTSCSSWRCVSAPQRAEFSLFASWFSRSLRCGGGDEETLTGWQLPPADVVATMENLSSVWAGPDSFPL